MYLWCICTVKFLKSNEDVILRNGTSSHVTINKFFIVAFEDVGKVDLTSLVALANKLASEVCR